MYYFGTEKRRVYFQNFVLCNGSCKLVGSWLKGCSRSDLKNEDAKTCECTECAHEPFLIFICKNTYLNAFV